MLSCLIINSKLQVCPGCVKLKVVFSVKVISALFHFIQSIVAFQLLDEKVCLVKSIFQFEIVCSQSKVFHQLKFALLSKSDCKLFIVEISCVQVWFVLSK